MGDALPTVRVSTTGVVIHVSLLTQMQRKSLSFCVWRLESQQAIRICAFKQNLGSLLDSHTLFGLNDWPRHAPGEPPYTCDSVRIVRMNFNNNNCIRTL